MYKITEKTKGHHMSWVCRCKIEVNTFIHRCLLFALILPCCGWFSDDCPPLAGLPSTLSLLSSLTIILSCV